jgi:hypothetical protein
MQYWTEATITITRASGDHSHYSPSLNIHLARNRVWRAPSRTELGVTDAGQLQDISTTRRLRMPRQQACNRLHPKGCGHHIGMKIDAQGILIISL